MTTSDKIALWALAISIAALLWTVIAAIWDRYERSRVILNASFEVTTSQKRGRALVMTLVNSGGTPLYVSKVYLEAACSTLKMTLSPFPPLPDHDSTPLMPGQARRYGMPHSICLVMLGDVRNARQYEYWISVHSPQGELAKLNDRYFLAALKWFVAEAYDPLPGGPSPSTPPG